MTETTAKDPKPTAERIEQLAQRVLIGDVMLPEFQRPFVWNRRQILELLDSIFKNYPIGSMLLWESNEKLASVRSIAGLEVGRRSEKYPVNYLLDGQQRLSTVCGVLYWKPGNPRSFWNVVFDLRSQKFSHVDVEDDLPLHQIPLHLLSDPANYFRRLSPLEDSDLRRRADRLFNRFKDYQVPIVTLGDMPIGDVAPVFERINSTGTRLTIFDLMRAATWSPEFDLANSVRMIKDRLEAKKFDSLDNKTFLRALGAAGGNDFSAESIDGLRHLDTEKLRDSISETSDSSARAADFLVTQIGVPQAEALPYANQFAVLCEIFRRIPHPDSRKLAEIRKWFWRTTLSSYFGGWNNGQMAVDARLIREFASGESVEIPVSAPLPREQVWSAKTFRANSAVSKMLAIMLGHAQPVDLVNGQRIDVGKSLAWSNDKEFHHFFPKAYLARADKVKGDSNAVANIVMLTSVSNINIRDRAPSEYLRALINEHGRSEVLSRLQASLVPEQALEHALVDDFDGFLEARSVHLHLHAATLMGESFGILTEAPDAIDDTELDPSE